MADENDNPTPAEKENSTYVRKKNLISGVDNDHLIIGLILGLGAVSAAPIVKQWIDSVIKNLPQNQPHNGAGIPQQQYAPLPVVQPPVQQQQVQQPLEQTPEQKYPDHNLLREYEQRQKEQLKYQAAQEQEAQSLNAAINMVPDRSQSTKKYKGYEAGSNVSGLST